MNKKLIRLTESDLHRIVKESVNVVLREAYKVDSIEDVRNDLIRDLEDCYTSDKIAFIDKRLAQIAKENNLSLDELRYLCDSNSNEMFACIFDYKSLDKNNFELG
jgi:hypothetical protein